MVSLNKKHRFLRSQMNYNLSGYKAVYDFGTKTQFGNIFGNLNGLSHTSTYSANQLYIRTDGNDCIPFYSTGNVYKNKLAKLK